MHLEKYFGGAAFFPAGFGSFNKLIRKGGGSRFFF